MTGKISTTARQKKWIPIESMNIFGYSLKQKDKCVDREMLTLRKFTVGFSLQSFSTTDAICLHPSLHLVLNCTTAIPECICTCYSV
jgi:hypothetical protein